jgi:hypothetical protein
MTEVKMKMTTIQTDNNITHAKSSICESETTQIQKKYGFKVDKWVIIREKNIFGML